MILFSFLLLIIPISNSEILAANPVPADCVSLTGYYPRAPEGVTYYTFGNPLETYNGYKSYFRVFIPPGAVVEDMLILEYGKQMAVARHNVIMPATVLPEFPPSGYIANNRYLLSELEADNQWVTENLEGYLYISHDSFYPYLENSRAGWLYVKVGGGQYSDYYSNQFTVKVDAKVYNVWWDKYIQNEEGWNNNVQNVGVYIDPTGTQPSLSVDPASRAALNTSGEVTFSVSNTGTGNMSWDAKVNTDGSWLKIKSGSSGVNGGSIVCLYNANTGLTERTETITVTATGATNSPIMVTVTQAGAGGRVVSIIPDTGLTDIRSIKINPISYTKLDKNGNDLPDSAESWVMIRDKVTGLVWESKDEKDGRQNPDNLHDSDNLYAWYDSNSATNGGYPGKEPAIHRKNTEEYINELNKNRFGGFNDWRLPTINEIISLSSYDSDPKISRSYFPNTQDGPYWTSDSYNYLNNNMCAWALDFKCGNTVYLSKDDEGYYARAVRGTRALLDAADRFKDNGDGTVTDKAYGLMWEKSPVPKFKKWDEALTYCDNLKLANYNDWRIPSVKELQSLADYKKNAPPAINKNLFSLDAPYFYWTATTEDGSIPYQSYAWFLDFTDGSPFAYLKSVMKNYVRAVREIPVISVSPSSKVVWYTNGSINFDVYVSGRDPSTCSANVIEGSDWLRCKLDMGDDKKTGTAKCEYDENTKAESRTATIQIIGNGADNSPVDLLLTQETFCAASESDGVLQLYNIVYGDSVNKSYYWGIFINQEVGRYYKLSNLGILPSVLCAEPATLDINLSIDIPLVVMGDKSCKMKLLFQENMSNENEFYFLATDEKCE